MAPLTLPESEMAVCPKCGEKLERPLHSESLCSKGHMVPALQYL